VYAPEPSTQSYLEEGTIMSETRGVLTVATLVSKHNLLVGEIMQPAEETFWRQRKVQRRAFLLFFLATLGLAVGARVAAKGGGSDDGLLTLMWGNLEPPVFECSNNASVGCRYRGEVSLGFFQDPTAFLVAFCDEDDFGIPTSDSCECEVSILDSASGNLDICQSCSFIDSANGWGFAYDCSNLIDGDCVGRDTAGNCIPNSRQCFDITSDLRDAVDEYLVDNGPGSRVASIYGYPIGNWCVSKIQDFSYLFSLDDDRDNTRRANLAVADFNEDISRWDVSNATTMKSMFAGVYTPAPGDIFRSILHCTHFNQSLADWNVSSVKDMSDMFRQAASFNQPLGDWNVVSVIDMSYMFGGASSFNQPLADWKVSSVIDMSYMFDLASSFNQPLADWDVSSAKRMGGMLYGAVSFNQPLADWDVSSATDMKWMFTQAIAFNQSIGNWDVSLVKNMEHMFESAESFNEPIGSWNVSSVESMNEMFLFAYSFNQPLANWDVSSLTDMRWMFEHAESFDQPIGNWDVSSVRMMSGVFWNALSFNQPLDKWDVSNVRDMLRMFAGASSFNQPLGNWDVNDTCMFAIFENSGCPALKDSSQSCFYMN
jgi:surface protein